MVAAGFLRPISLIRRQQRPYHPPKRLRRHGILPAPEILAVAQQGGRRRRARVAEVIVLPIGQREAQLIGRRAARVRPQGQLRIERRHQRRDLRRIVKGDNGCVAILKIER